MAVCLVLIMAFVVGLVGASRASAIGTTCTIKDLGTLPSAKCSYSSASGINASGQVVGYSCHGARSLPDEVGLSSHYVS